MGLKQCSILSQSTSSYYTDPWKSDQRIKTVVLLTEEVIDVTKIQLEEEEALGYFTIPLREGV